MTYIKLLSLAFLVLVSNLAFGQKSSDPQQFSYGIMEATTTDEIATSADELFQYVGKNDKKYLNLIQSGERSLQFEINSQVAAEVFAYKNRTVILDDFRLPNGESGQLRLTKARPVYDANTTFIAKGKKIQMPLINSYYGTIKGMDDVEVYLTEHEGNLVGAIYSDETNYNIGSVYNGNSNDNLHIIKESNKSIDPMSGYRFCGVEEEDFDNIQIDYNDVKDLGETKDATGFLEVKLTLVGAYDYLRIVAAREGSLSSNASIEDYVEWEENTAVSDPIFEQAIVYMTQVMEMTSRVYERQVNLRFNIDSIIQFGSNDPLITLQLPGQREDAGVKLNAMPDVWNSRTDESHFVVMFNNSRADNNSNILGIAMGGQPRQGNFCIRDRGYCVVGVGYDYVEPTFDGSDDVHTTAHEIGHLFGAPHTHNAYWFTTDPQVDVRDTCVTRTSPPPGTGDAYITDPSLRRPRTDGTIMSYCHLGGSVVTRFHPYVASNLLRYASQRAQCVDNPEVPIVRLTNLLGENVLSPGTEDIRWRSHGINQVDLAYSINGGENWEIIAEGVNSADGLYKWNVPSITTDDLMVEIYESGNRQPGTNLYDASLKGIRVENKFVSITAPTEGLKLGYQVDYLITWEANLITNTEIHYSTNDGGDWILAGESEKNSYLWDVPDLTIGEVLIRVSEKGNSDYSDIVEVLVGQEDGEIVLPSDGMTVCQGWENYAFEFRTEYVETVTFEYSTDGGSSYKNVQLLGTAEVPARDNIYYVWNEFQDDGLTTDYRLRMIVFNPGGDEIVLDEVTLTIDDCEWVSVEEESSIGLKLNISSIVPNPASQKTDITYISTIPPGNVDIKVFDMKGTELISISDLAKVGENKIEIDISSLAGGNYVLVISGGGSTNNAVLKIAR